MLPEFQSQGFGSQLMDFAEDKIAEIYSRIHIDSSLAAKEMYLKRGYREKRTCKIETENGIYNLFRLGLRLRFDRGDLCENRYYTWTES